MNNKDCFEIEAVYANPDDETQTYNELAVYANPDDETHPYVPQGCLRRKSRYKFIFIVILAVCVSSFLSVGVTYFIIKQLNKNGVTSNSATGNLLTENVTTHPKTNKSPTKNMTTVPKTGKSSTKYVTTNPQTKTDICSKLDLAGNIVYRSLGTNILLTSPRLHTFPSECPAGWLNNKLSCFKMSDNKKTWFQAFDFCRSLGSDLVSFPHQNEENFVQQRLQNEMTLWTGLNDLDKDGRFEWSDGTKLKYTNWGTDEPNRFNSVEDCVELDTGKVWNDANCYIPKNFVCKIEMSSQCGKGSWIFFNDSCYKFNTRNKLSWNAARQLCRSKDADLIIIQTREELNFVLSQLFQLSGYIWIGLTNRNHPSEYRWIDGEIPWNLPWGRNQPIIYEVVCVLINLFGNMESQYCHNRNGFICEKQL